MAQLNYLTGFGNQHETEALAGALPEGQFSPQHPPLGLFPEQFSSTAFTQPRADNRRTWLYRIAPSVVQGDYQPLSRSGNAKLSTAPDPTASLNPQPMRWLPFADPAQPTDFVSGLATITVAGDAQAKQGGAVHIYHCAQPMTDRFFCNADGELLFIPHSGSVRLRTECGVLDVAVGEIALVPAGMRFAVDPIGIGSEQDATDPQIARGFLCENYGAPLRLAERGPVGANGYANERDFLYPTACYEDRVGAFRLVTKFAGALYESALSRSPLNVVAWAGNSAPYKYDLARFNVMGSISYDHPDPSIYTVLTSPTEVPGLANLDFVIFPPRWQVAEHTFRPPWYHRNCMSECMGLVRGSYDAKAEGFLPGGVSLHNAYTPHGPDVQTHQQATAADLAPMHTGDGLAFMLESRLAYAVCDWAFSASERDRSYSDCWQDLPVNFKAP